MSIQLDAVRKIYSSNSEEKVQKKLKNATDAKLANILHCIRDENSANKSDWKFAVKVFKELSLRQYAKEHTKELRKIQKVISTRTNTLLLDSKYTIESVGILKKDRKKGVSHAYPRSNPIKKIAKQWEKSKTSKSLDKYVESKISSKQRSKLEEKQVTYLSKKDYKDYAVTFVDKKIYVGGIPVFNTNFIFALDQTGKILLAAEKEKGYFQHSSFFRGAPVRCAGHFIIKDEKVKGIVLKSGHYKPTEASGKYLREFLSDEKYLGKDAKKLSIKKH